MLIINIHIQTLGSWGSCRALEELGVNNKQTYPAQASGSNVKHIRSTYGAPLIRVMVIYKHGASMEQKQEKHEVI